MGPFKTMKTVRAFLTNITTRMARGHSTQRKTDLYFLIGLVNGRHLVLFVQCRLIAKETHQALVAQTEEFDLFMILARVRVSLCVQDGIQRERGVPLHDVGELQARGQQGIREGPPALRTVPRPVMFLPAPVLSDALATEVVLAAETHRVLINA